MPPADRANDRTPQRNRAPRGLVGYGFAAVLTATMAAALGAHGCSLGRAGLGPANPPDAGAGGEDAVECVSPSDCPGADLACRRRNCPSNRCGVYLEPAGTPCDDDGGRVCSGLGECVRCAAPSDCDPGDNCEANLCVPATCADGVLDGTETDVDCGGGACAPCGNGESCTTWSDCESAFCEVPDGATSGSCASCSGEVDCAAAPDHWCDTEAPRMCEPRRPVGDVCTGDHQCTSGACPPQDGVCCDEPCADTCRACLESKTGVANGTCDLVDPSIAPDPDNECAPVAPTECGSTGEGCTGTSASCVLYDATTECAPGSCAGGQATAPSLCSGSGSCIGGLAAACAPLTCNAGATACLTACNQQADCIATHYCDAPGSNGSCLLKHNNGDDCGQGYECTSLICESRDNVCCPVACNSWCDSCDGARNGGSPGQCLRVTACDGCQQTFGGVADVHEICNGTASECWLRVSTQNQSCAELCESVGGSCVAFFDDSNDQCTWYGGSGTGCASTNQRNSAMCICSPP